MSEAQKQPKPAVEPIGDMSIKYEGRLVQVCEQPVRLPNGRETTFEITRRPPGVRIMALVGNRMLLTREFRHEHDGWDYRLPGGKVADDPSYFTETAFDPVRVEQEARAAASRELLEETGLFAHPDDLRLFAISRCGATIEWDLNYFVARFEDDRVPSRPEFTEEGEAITCAFHDMREVLNLVLGGEVREDRTAAVLARFAFMDFTDQQRV